MAFIDVIEYTGDNDTLVYKYPHSDFSTMSQLIVRETQTAILYKDGKMLDEFKPGKYTLHTGNIPLLSKLVNLPFGGTSPFQCDVYFINKAIALNYKWGTKTKTKVMDMQYHLLLDIGASGVMGLRVKDPYTLMRKIVGTQSGLRAETCFEYFREEVSARVKQYLAAVMKKPEMDFLLLETYLSDFSAAVKSQLAPLFSDIGVELYNFIIATINVPDEQYAVITQGQIRLQEAWYNNQVKKMNAQGDSDVDVIRSQGRAKSRQIEGYNWADERIAEITKIYASNSQLVENPANMIAQAPMTIAFANMLSGNVEKIMDHPFSNPGLNFSGGANMFGQNQGQQMGMPGMSGMGFAGAMEEDISPAGDMETQYMPYEQPRASAEPDLSTSELMEDLKKRIEQAKWMYDNGFIGEEEYNAKKKEIMDRI